MDDFKTLRAVCAPFLGDLPAHNVHASLAPRPLIKACP
jgi:hypothetical protein